MKGYFFLDAETDGLYGSTLSIAARAVDAEFNEIDTFYGAVNPETVSVKSDWVKENVLHTLKSAYSIYSCEAELLQAFWNFYILYSEDFLCIADVPYPVEYGVFKKCVMEDPDFRAQQAPYPFVDLASILLAEGIDPLTPRKEIFHTRLEQHDALNDVIMAVEIFKKLTGGNTGGADDRYKG